MDLKLLPDNMQISEEKKHHVFFLVNEDYLKKLTGQKIPKDKNSYTAGRISRIGGLQVLINNRDVHDHRSLSGRYDEFAQTVVHESGHMFGLRHPRPDPKDIVQKPGTDTKNPIPKLDNKTNFMGYADFARNIEWAQIDWIYSNPEGYHLKSYRKPLTRAQKRLGIKKGDIDWRGLRDDDTNNSCPCCSGVM